MANFSTGYKQHAMYLIARYLDKHLNHEILLGLNYPQNLQADYLDMAWTEKKLWFEITYTFLLQDSTRTLSCGFNRGLSKSEVGLIRRRIVNYLKSSGFSYDRA